MNFGPQLDSERLKQQLDSEILQQNTGACQAAKQFDRTASRTGQKWSSIFFSLTEEVSKMTSGDGYNSIHMIKFKSSQLQ